MNKPKRKQLDWSESGFGNCGCGNWERLADGECAECHDANYEHEIECFYLDRIKELEQRPFGIDPQEVIDKMRQITIERPLFFHEEVDKRYSWPRRWDDLVDWLAGKMEEDNARR